MSARWAPKRSYNNRHYLHLNGPQGNQFRLGLAQHLLPDPGDLRYRLSNRVRYGTDGGRETTTNAISALAYCDRPSFQVHSYYVFVFQLFSSTVECCSFKIDLFAI